MALRVAGPAMEGVVNKVTPSSDANGPTKPHTPAAMAAKTAVRPRDARQARFAQSFAQIVAVLMRDPNFRNMRLADLEWLVLPPVMAAQFRLAQIPMRQGRAQDGGILVPVAVALWARVSAQLDNSLSGNLDKQVRLRPNEWASGDHLWLMALAGDQRALPKFLEQLGETEFKGQRVKMRMRGPDGKVVVKVLGQPA